MCPSVSFGSSTDFRWVVKYDLNFGIFQNTLTHVFWAAWFLNCPLLCLCYVCQFLYRFHTFRLSYLNKLQTWYFKKLWCIYVRENLAQGFTSVPLRKILPLLLVSPACQKLQKPNSQKNERYTRYVHFCHSLFRSENINILSRLQSGTRVACLLFLT